MKEAEITTRKVSEGEKKRRRKLAASAVCVLELTWGFLQSLSGLVVFLFSKKERVFFHRGVLVTRWGMKGSLSLGFFVFVSGDGDCELVLHEYGHCLQSLILGPLYLFAVGLPSLLWAGLPVCRRYRRRRSVSYYSFFTERWADRLAGVVR